ncbi:MAG: hypothetical protein D6741_03750 [Planctomycetota bacterium]|nr:MAG: hypothetical protein D6741_03750 [Planctomycetota bacterium]
MAHETIAAEADKKQRRNMLPSSLKTEPKETQNTPQLFWTTPRRTVGAFVSPHSPSLYGRCVSEPLGRSENFAVGRSTI